MTAAANMFFLLTTTHILERYGYIRKVRNKHVQGRVYVLQRANFSIMTTRGTLFYNKTYMGSYHKDRLREEEEERMDALEHSIKHRGSYQ